MLLAIWYISFYHPPAEYAWIIAATLIPVGFIPAINDISLDSYIQSSLTLLKSKHRNISPLGAVMAFLYSTYIIIYLTANPFLSRDIDNVYNIHGTVYSALIYTAAVPLTVICVVICIATCIPKGARALNPTLHDEDGTTDGNNTEEKLDVWPDTNINQPKIDKQDI